MAVIHPAERPARACVKGGLLFGIDQGLLSDGDLSTLAAAKTAVDVDNALLHVSQRTFGQRVKGSLEIVNSYDSTYLAGGDADKASMLAISEATRGRTTRF